METSATAPAEIKAWLECLCWFGGFVLIMAGVVALIRGQASHRKVKVVDQPLQVDANIKPQRTPAKRFNHDHWEERYQEHTETLDDHEKRIDVVEKKQSTIEAKLEADKGAEDRLTQQIQKFEDDSKESRRRMHGEITGLEKQVSALQAKSEITNQTLIAISGKLDRLAEKGKS